MTTSCCNSPKSCETPVLAEGPLLSGAKIRLRPFTRADITPRYLGWLSDPVVNRYSQRRNQTPVSADQAFAYLESRGQEEVILAIETPKEGHVGNVKYGPIDRQESRADISILIGEPSVWGKGIGAEAVHLVTRHLFETEGLARVDAGTANPSFLRLVEKLGWQRETESRIRVGDEDVAYTTLRLLATECHPLQCQENAAG